MGKTTVTRKYARRSLGDGFEVGVSDGMLQKSISKSAETTSGHNVPVPPTHDEPRAAYHPPVRGTEAEMEPDDLLCSRNARSPKTLVGRAQWKIIQPPSLRDNEQA